MKKSKGVSYKKFRDHMLILPEVVESSSYDTPSFKVRGKLVARLKEDGETIVVRIDYGLRSNFIESQPEAFFITEHYEPYPWVLIRLAQVYEKDLVFLLEQAWRLTAPHKMVAARDALRRLD